MYFDICERKIFHTESVKIKNVHYFIICVADVMMCLVMAVKIKFGLCCKEKF
jgi:hypothetical protein